MYTTNFTKESLIDIINSLIFSVDCKKRLLNNCISVYTKTNKKILLLEENIKSFGTSAIKSSKMKKLLQEKEKIETMIYSINFEMKYLSSSICALRAIRKGNSKKEISEIILKYFINSV